GDPVPNAGVQVKMLQHDFAFGSAITAERLPGNNNQNIIYYNKILDLDGQGHGFNWVVFENDLKWPAWEDEWFVNKSELVSAVSWLRSNNIKIRGHTLVWPGSTNLPSDINNNLNDLPYIQNRINTHLNTVLNYPGIAGEIAEWDVINETVTNTTLANAFAGNPGYANGRELYAEIFQQTRNEDSLTGLWLNDFVTLTLSNEAGSPQYETLKQYLGEIVNSGAPIDGIGFQGHIGGFPNGIPSVLATYDDFYQAYGLKAKVTEFDLPSIVNEELAAKYLVDFLTATFSHESMNGFMFWNFWDGATWRSPAANLFRQDWTLSQPGQAFFDLVFDEWWTEELLYTQTNGQASVKGFKGMYEISYVCNGQWVKDTISLTEARNYEIVCDQVTTDIEETSLSPLSIYPNPATDRLMIDGPREGVGEVRIMDLQGRLVQSFGAKSLPFEAQLQLPSGVYVCEYRRDAQLLRQKLVIQN
ncbi:MAG: endo-1,4-beta-xylanase, partial [Bacteroidota bacterium]